VNPLRLAVGAVWLHQGLWHKLLHPDADQRAIVPRMLAGNAALLAAAWWVARDD
jgi:hypothetical protein